MCSVDSTTEVNSLHDSGYGPLEEVHMESGKKAPVRWVVILIIATGLVSLLSTVSSKLINITFAQDCPCTDYARERRPDLVGICTGMAAKWGLQATAASYPVDATPSAGDIAVFQYPHHGTQDSRGHVAYVEKVNPDGTFDISEQGYIDDPCNTHYRSGLSVEETDEFIHHKGPYPVLVSDVVVHPNPVVGGQRVYLNFTIRNSGGSTLNIKEVFVAVTTAKGGLWKAWAAPQSIGEGSSKSFIAVGDAWADHAGTWQVDDIAIQDTGDTWYDVNLNGRSMPSFDVVVTVPGDLNGNCVVDIFDLVIVGSNFGEDPADPDVDSRADANGDGEVDIFDLVLVGSHFGDACGVSTLPSSSEYTFPQLATVRVLPETRVVRVGNDAKVAIQIVEVSDLFGFQLDLSYDPLILEYASWESGGFLGAGYKISPNASTPGTIKDMAAARTTPGVSVSGTGTLVTVTLRTIAEGSSTISIENLKLADAEANEISSTAQDGRIRVGEEHLVFLPFVTKSLTP